MSQTLPVEHQLGPKLISKHKRLLFFSLEDWNEVWRRNQFFCSLLHDRHPDADILWVCPPLDLSYNFSRGVPNDFELSLSARSNSLYPRIFLYRPVKILPNFVGRSFNNAAMRMQVENVLARLGWTSFDTWINDQRARRYSPVCHGGRVIYDITDDWTVLPQSERARRAVIEDDRWLLEHADSVIVCSKQLVERKQKQNCQAILISNGVDFQRYHPAKLANLEIPADLANITRPIAGYTGTLHSERLNIDLILDLGRALPEVSFVFIGPDCLESADSTALRLLPNIHLLGSKPYDLLPSYIANFQCCICPHQITPFTESLDPLKLYEYMSTGLPVISTPCSGFRDFPELVQLAPDAHLFAECIRTILVDSSPQLSEQRLQWAAQQSWENRIGEVEKVLGWQRPSHD